MPKYMVSLRVYLSLAVDVIADDPTTAEAMAKDEYQDHLAYVDREQIDVLEIYDLDAKKRVYLDPRLP